MDRYSIRTEQWAMELPTDWTEIGRTDAGEVYFESGDGTKGIYVAACLVEEGTGRTSGEVAQSFRSAGLSSLREMQGYNWELAADEAVTEGDTVIVLTDAIAQAQGYRIACKVVALLPVVVRAAFHDYLCEDLDASQRYFAPMIESLRVNGPLH
jgi:hypothetical protein